MRITVSHNKNPEEIKRNVDRSFDDVFKGLPLGPIQITDEQRTWNGQTMTFSFNAKAAFMAIPIKGWVLVEQKQLTIDVDLPAFLQNMIPEEKMKAAVEGRVRGLLT